MKDKVAILTAAGTGMGADAAKKLVSEGFRSTKLIVYQFTIAKKLIKIDSNIFTTSSPYLLPSLVVTKKFPS